MDLGLNPADVEIKICLLFNERDTVYLRFRRPIDVDVKKAIMGLNTRYGWKVKRYDPKDKFRHTLCGDFEITTVGATSDVVGNAIAKVLEKDHGLTSSLYQFVKINAESSSFRQVEQLDLKA